MSPALQYCRVRVSANIWSLYSSQFRSCTTAETVVSHCLFTVHFHFGFIIFATVLCCSLGKQRLGSIRHLLVPSYPDVKRQLASRVKLLLTYHRQCHSVWIRSIRDARANCSRYGIKPTIIVNDLRVWTSVWYWTPLLCTLAEFLRLLCLVFHDCSSSCLTCSLPRQFFHGCHPLVGLSFAEVPSGYLLRCRCVAELHVLNDEYTHQWHLPMHINWRDNLAVAVKVLNN